MNALGKTDFINITLLSMFPMFVYKNRMLTHFKKKKRRRNWYVNQTSITDSVTLF